MRCLAVPCFVLAWLGFAWLGFALLGLALLGLALLGLALFAIHWGRNCKTTNFQTWLGLALCVCMRALF